MSVLGYAAALAGDGTLLPLISPLTFPLSVIQILLADTIPFFRPEMLEMEHRKNIQKY